MEVKSNLNDSCQDAKLLQAFYDQQMSNHEQLRGACLFDDPDEWPFIKVGRKGGKNKKGKKAF